MAVSWSVRHLPGSGEVVNGDGQSEKEDHKDSMHQADSALIHFLMQAVCWGYAMHHCSGTEELGFWKDVYCVLAGSVRPQAETAVEELPTALAVGICAVQRKSKR